MNRFAFSAPEECSALSRTRKQQDDLTTGMEYMTYEYNIYAKFAKHQRREKWFEAQWKKLADSGAAQAPCDERVLIITERSVWQRSDPDLQGRGAGHGGRSIGNERSRPPEIGGETEANLKQLSDTTTLYRDSLLPREATETTRRIRRDTPYCYSGYESRYR